MADVEATPASSPITITTTYLAASKPSLPGLVLQVTQLVDSYMLWIGIATGGPEDKEGAVAQGSLCKDWAVAMPPREVSRVTGRGRGFGAMIDFHVNQPSTVASATSLFRTVGSDVALGMAQRLGEEIIRR
jgi:hypothetical protein